MAHSAGLQPVEKMNTCLSSRLRRGEKHLILSHEFWQNSKKMLEKGFSFPKTKT